MHIEKYPSTHSHLKEFREICERAGRETTADSWRSIVGVGMPFDPKKGFSMRDQYLFAASLITCHEMGFSVAPDFDFSSLEYGEGKDFLSPECRVQADLLMVGMVLDEDKIQERFKAGAVRPSGKPFASSQELRQFLVGEHEGHPALKTSPLHTKAAWRATAEQSGARAIAALHRNYEIDADNFRGPAYPITRHIPVPDIDGVPGFMLDIILCSKDGLDYLRREKPPIAILQS